MKLYAPDFFPRFRCLMGACRHSCCVGWEIDIDDESMARYRAVPGEMGRRLSENIEETPDGACFRLTADERCPFLNPDGLCDLILNLGEESLCQICDDHPRFRNFFSDRTEIGLGLCCEAAGALILGQETPMQLIELSDDECDGHDDPEEQRILELRSALIRRMQDRTKSFDDRIRTLLAPFSLTPEDFCWEEWISFLLSLERLDEAWTALLSESIDSSVYEPDFLETALEQLSVYLLYRHLPGAVEDGNECGRALIAAFGTLLIRRLCRNHIARCGSLALSDVVEFARLFSSEIEYSTENLDSLLDRLADFCADQSPED